MSLRFSYVVTEFARTKPTTIKCGYTKADRMLLLTQRNILSWIGEFSTYSHSSFGP